MSRHGAIRTTGRRRDPSIQRRLGSPLGNRAAAAADLPAAVLIVSHVSSQSRSYLPEILSRAGPVPATSAEARRRSNRGASTSAPPDFHLLLHKEHMRIVRGPRENNHRPAIDPLFRTAARAFGSRVIGIVLSGSLDDGTAGLFAIKGRGGIAIVQDPDDAMYPDMRATLWPPCRWILASPNTRYRKLLSSDRARNSNQSRCDRGA